MQSFWEVKQLSTTSSLWDMDFGNFEVFGPNFGPENAFRPLFSLITKSILKKDSVRTPKQRQKVGDKFKKLSKIDCFVIFIKNRQNLVFGWTAGYAPSNLSISEIFLKFPNFLRSLSVKWFGNSWSNSYIHFLVI